MKTYSAAPDADSCIANIRESDHAELDGVTVMALFAFDSESGDPVLKHQGYAAGAVCRITPLRDRAAGMTDASIVIDRATWLTLSQRQRDALIDHELTHVIINRGLDKDGKHHENNWYDVGRIEVMDDNVVMTNPWAAGTPAKGPEAKPSPHSV